jgi:hypothetical protein
VRPAVDALEQHAIDLRDQRGDVIDDLDAVLLLDLLGVAGDAVDGGRDVRAAAGERRDDLALGGVAGLGGVDDLGEGGGVRGVEADDADL